MTSLVVLFSSQIKLKSKAVTKILSKKLHCDTVMLTDLFNAMKKLWEKISFHKSFKSFDFL